MLEVRGRPLGYSIVEDEASRIYGLAGKFGVFRAVKGELTWSRGGNTMVRY